MKPIINLIASTALTLSLTPPSPGAEESSPEFSARRAMALLVRQCEFGPRNPGSEGHRRCGDWLADTLRKHADQLIEQPFRMTFGTPPKTVEARNLIARFNPETRPRLLFCAHWDTRPWADKDPDPGNRSTPILGANDGASGVAVLLELARVIRSRKPKVGVDIVLFDGEDAGRQGTDREWIQGSRYFTEHLAAGDRPRYGVLIDMIGDADLQIRQESYSRRYAGPIVDLIWRIAAELQLSGFKTGAGYAVLDDHIPLLEAGIPCVDLIDFDYPPWHTLADTPDKCSADSLGQVGRLLVELIYRESSR